MRTCCPPASRPWWASPAFQDCCSTRPAWCSNKPGLLFRETGFHIGMDRNFVCLWHRHNCIDLSLSALISWFMK
jgi:hypothetical protein